MFVQNVVLLIRTVWECVIDIYLATPPSNNLTMNPK